MPLLKQRLTTLIDAMPAAQAGDMRSVHQARVATRRLREALPVLRASVNAHALGRVRRQVRRMTRALGPVRELDVALAHLDELAARSIVSRRALGRVRQAIAQRAARASPRDADAITPGKVEKLRHRLGRRRHRTETPPQAPRRSRRRAAGRRGAPDARRRRSSTPAGSISPIGCTRCASPPRSCATRWRSSAS